METDTSMEKGMMGMMMVGVMMAILPQPAEAAGGIVWGKFMRGGK